LQSGEEGRRIETRELNFERVSGSLVADIASDIMHLQAMEGMGDWGFREGDPLTESVDEETLMFFAVDHFVPLSKKIEI